MGTKLVIFWLYYKIIINDFVIKQKNYKFSPHLSFTYTWYILSSQDDSIQTMFSTLLLQIILLRPKNIHNTNINHVEKNDGKDTAVAKVV